ncbi:unnamed protein product [Agarophyton chilense]
MEHLMRSDFFIKAFVTESMRDANAMPEECYKTLGFRLDVFSASTTDEDEPDMYTIQHQDPARPVDDSSRSMGIVDVVSKIYNAPVALRSALNAQLNLRNVHLALVRDNKQSTYQLEQWWR